VARLFVQASTQQIYVTSTVVTGPPFTMACWVNPTSIAANTMNVLALSDASTTNNFYILGLYAGGGVASAVRALAFDPAAQAYAQVAVEWPTGQPFHVAYVEASSSSRYCYYQGSPSIEETTNVQPSGIDTVSISGRVRNGAPRDTLDGAVSHFGLWNVELNAVEIAALAAGADPRMIRPQSLVDYWTLVRTDQDIVGGYDMTPVNAPTWTDQPGKVFGVAPVHVGLGTAAGGATYDEALTLAEGRNLQSVGTASAVTAASLEQNEMLTPVIQALADAQETLLRIGGLSATAALEIALGLSLGRTAALQAVMQALSAATIDLSRVEEAAFVALAVADAQIALQQTHGITISSLLAVIDVALSLARSESVDATVQAQAVALLSMLETEGLSALATAAGQAILSLARTHSFTASSLTGLIEVSLTLARSLGFAVAGQADVSAAVSLLRAEGIEASAVAVSDAAIVLDLVRAIDASTGQEFDVSLALGIAQSLASSSQRAINVIFALEESRDVAAGGIATAEGTLALTEERAIALVAAAIAEAGLSLDVVEAITLSSTLGVIVTTAARTYLVPAEDRTYEAPSESRTYVVPAEIRTHES